MATQDVTVSKAVGGSKMSGLKNAIKLDLYDVYTSETGSTYPHNYATDGPQTIVVVYEKKGSSNTWAKATMNTSA